MDRLYNKHGPLSISVTKTDGGGMRIVVVNGKHSTGYRFPEYDLKKIEVCKQDFVMRIEEKIANGTERS